jgi:hypothetical protein
MTRSTVAGWAEGTSGLTDIGYGLSASNKKQRYSNRAYWMRVGQEIPQKREKCVNIKGFCVCAGVRCIPREAVT